MLYLRFEIPGSPRGKGRPRFSRATGRAFNDTATRNYESEIRGHTYEAMDKFPPCEGPVEIMIDAVMPIPNSWPKWKQEAARIGSWRAVGTPDLDQIIKASLDGMNTVAYRDDRQVACIRANQRYGERPRLEIEVREVEQATHQSMKETANDQS
ncbi:RusA family crossover junction endodeoxyribonuclease [Ruegeria arenilitoris]|uniref:RusA family crossover junction endodeoxyribonuclease n=1 Tax=Ruegeria arenilitoris TaxID=1173585 RepID=UPI00148110F7|nr:RusA family crossover junction endodeoxyribonuclease [Ruegeria arenilitoris]